MRAGSQSDTDLSADPAASTLPSALKDSEFKARPHKIRARSDEQLSRLRLAPWARSHTHSRPSMPPAASRRPSGLAARLTSSDE